MISMIRIIVLVLCMCTFFGAEAQCPVDNSNTYSFEYEGKVYDIVKEKLKWKSAALCASRVDGVLVEINSEEEQDTLWHHINLAEIDAAEIIAPDGGEASYLWIGGNDIAEEGKWLWDGDNLAESIHFWQGTQAGMAIDNQYTNWGNEPDDFNEQDALAIAFTDWPLGFKSQWNDIDIDNALYYIIERSKPVSTKAQLVEVLSVYPNPSSDVLNIELTGDQLSVKDLQFTLRSIEGKSILEQSVNQRKTTIQIGEIPAGVYIGDLTTQSTVIASNKIKIVK